MPGDGRKRSFLLKYRHSRIVGIVHVKLGRDAMGSHSLLEHLLEVIGIVIIEEAAAHQEPGVVVDDHDAVDPPALAVLGDIRKVARIALISMSG